MPGPETPDGMDRRSLIKRGAAAGAAAWTAPLILDSVLSPAGAQSAPGPPPPAPAVATGIRFVNASNSSNNGGGAVTLTYGGTPTATTATSSPPVPNGNTRSYTASVQLIDQYGAPFVNAGASITVAITRTGGNGGPTSASLAIANGASVSSGSTTMTFANGDTQGALNAAATINAVAVTATVSTTTP